LNKEKKEMESMQGSKLYVGNLAYSATSDELRDLFAVHGTVVNVNLIGDKGFGFIEMSSPDEAEKAQQALNGFEYKDRAMKVDEARERESRPRRDSRGGRPSGGSNRRF
jgi:RNA recognition motif-containing protein